MEEPITLYIEPLKADDVAALLFKREIAGVSLITGGDQHKSHKNIFKPQDVQRRHTRMQRSSRLLIGDDLKAMSR